MGIFLQKTLVTMGVFLCLLMPNGPIFTVSQEKREIAYTFMRNESNNTETIENPTTFETKRIWVYVTSDTFISDGAALFVKTKKNLVSKGGEYKKLSSYTTAWNATYYYFDIGIDIYGFDISALDTKTNSITNTCEWIYRPEPTFIYEVTNDVPAKIRQRSVDVGWNNKPDAFVIGLLLSSFSTYSPAYENGYGGYLSIDTNWLSYYRGSDDELSSIFISDYTEEEYNEQNLALAKTRTISVASKIQELKEAYSSKPHSKKKTNSFDLIFEICSLVFVFSLSLALFLIIKKHAKQK